MIDLKSYLDENLDRLDNLEIYSILNCLSEEDIETLYFDYGLSEIIVRYIEKYMHEQDRSYRNIIFDLLNQFESTLPEKRIKLREILVSLAFKSSYEIQSRIFILLSESENKIENRRSAQISKLVWNEDVQQKVVDIYRKSKDKHVAVELINNMDADDASRYFSELWNDSLRNSEKQRLIEKANPSEVILDKYLKKVDLKHYLLTMVKRNIRLNEVPVLYTGIEYKDRIYIKWTAGKYNRGNLLLELIELDKNLKDERS